MIRDHQLCVYSHYFNCYYLKRCIGWRSLYTQNYIVKANGNSVITGTEFLSAIGSGKVVTLHKSEGDMVNAGDVIISLSSGQEGLQASSLNKQLEKLRAKKLSFKNLNNH